MPIIAEYLDNPSYDHWKIMHLEKEILEKFDHPDLTVLSGTYLPRETLAQVLEQVKSSDHNHAVMVSLMDPFQGEEIQEAAAHPRFHLLSAEQFWLWLVATHRNFRKYTQAEVAPNQKFSWKFLCYQNKIFPPREHLYDTLDKLNSGIVTLSGHGVRDFNSVLDESCGMHETFLHQPVPIEEHMPNDIWSLGNLDIWKGSFLNIVSETVQTFDPNQHNMFLSEKSVKPLIGMRPFLHFGSAKISEILRQKGFETFEEDFGYQPDGCMENQARQLSEIITQIDNPEALYQKLYPKILHNRNHYEKACQAEWQVLDDFICSVHSQIAKV
jgi:hypothetical protein